ncbi:MAG: DUF1801 domain-containing protein [Planctomycetota bacterium]
MQSKAKTVAEYLASLPGDRREAIASVRGVILKHLDKEYAEDMSYGMIGYHVPLSIYPPGYHCNPQQGLPFAGLASQKNYMSLYLMGLYEGTEEEGWFRAAWKATGKKLDMGKCCIRFKRVEDLALDVIAEAVRRMPAKRWIGVYEQARAGAAGKAGARGSTAKAKTGAAGAKKAGKKAAKKPAKKGAAR